MRYSTIPNTALGSIYRNTMSVEVFCVWNDDRPHHFRPMVDFHNPPRPFYLWPPRSIIFLTSVETAINESILKMSKKEWILKLYTTLNKVPGGLACGVR